MLNCDLVGTATKFDTIELEITKGISGTLIEKVLAVVAKFNLGAADTLLNAAYVGNDAAADETLVKPVQVPIIHAGMGSQLRFQHFQILVLGALLHFLVFDLDCAHGAGRAGMRAPRLRPALVQEMSFEDPFLRKL